MDDIHLVKEFGKILLSHEDLRVSPGSHVKMLCILDVCSPNAEIVGSESKELSD